MLNKIISFSIKNKLIIALFTIALIIYGAVELRKLPIDAVPDITNNQVQIITAVPSMGASDIERLITFPIEQANANIPGLIEIRSFSRFGLSLVTIVFDEETDLYWARQQVAERLQKIKEIIPKGIGNPELGPVTTGLGEIYQYVLRPLKGYESRYSITELRTIQDWIVRRQLLGVKGVAEVSSFGGKLKQYEVAINTDKLNAHHLSIAEVFLAIEKNNENTGGAYIEKGPSVLYIRTEGLITQLEQIKNIAVKRSPEGTPLFIKDIADVKIGSAVRYGAMTYNTDGEVAGAVVMMLKGGNSNDVIVNIKKRIAEIQKTLPQGLIIEPFLDRTKMVNNAIHTVESNLLEGALIVIFILVVFLGNFRAGLLTASVIPLAMLFAIIMMNLFGVSGNLMSLGALDFGLIVDGAVIIIEAVMHQMSHSNKFPGRKQILQHEMDGEVQHAASKMMNSAVFGQIIILVVYLPILTLQGIEGKMFKPMAQTVAFALIGAFLLSLTYIPMMSALFLNKKVGRSKNISDRVMTKIESLYSKLLAKIIRVPKTVISTILLMLIASIITLSSLGGEFIPALEEGDFAVETRVLTGSNISTTIEQTQKASKILLERFPEVERIVTKIGSGEVPTDPMPMEAADMMIILKDKSEWKNASGFNDLSEKMSKALEEVTGVTFGFQYPVQMRFNELMTGAKQDVVCKIFGENLDSLTAYAEKLGKIIHTVEGAQDVYVESVTGMPQVIIQFKRDEIAKYGTSIQEVNKCVNTAFAGQSAGLVFEEERRFDLVVRLNNENRKNANDIKNLLISLPSGEQIPLSHLAEVEIKDGPNQIQREDAKRRIIVGFNVRGRDVQSIVNELQEKVNGQLLFASGYYPTYGGAFENLNAAKARLSIAVPVSLILIFLLLYFAFNSIKQGLLIYSAIPLSAIGGIFALAIRGMPFSISAGIGFIALFGVAVLNGIVLVAEFNRLKKEGILDPIQVVITGTKLRLRPVLMTAMVASLGFLPMAMSNGAGAEVQRPLATVVIGGLLLATLLTLFVLPVLYLLFDKVKKEKSPMKVAIIVPFFFLTSFSSFAQQTISLESAIAIALKNNLQIKNENLKADYQKALVRSAMDIPMTQINSEYGQINSSYYDNRFSINQSFSFPLVYARQKSLYNEEWKMKLLGTALKEKEVKELVSSVYQKLLLLYKREQLLVETDSIYRAYLKSADQKLRSGESNILERTAAETSQGQVMIQTNQIRMEIELEELQFQLLLNSNIRYKPEMSDLKVPLKINSDSSQLKQHPVLKQLEQENKMAVIRTRLEKAKLLPEFHLGYNNMSMRGVGSDGVDYTLSSRFQSAQLGIGIPIIFGAQRSRINAGKTALLISQNSYANSLQLINNEFSSLVNRIEAQKKIISYFENTALKNAELILKNAQEKLKAGDIDYMQWTQLIHQAINVKIDYLNTLSRYNESVIKLNSLTSN